MLFDSKTMAGMAACALIAMAAGVSGPVRADSGAGWFLGGMVTSKVLSNMERRTQAEEAQAHQRQQPQSVQRAAPTAPPQMTAEQKLQQLDRLAAGGYITPEEYKAKKKQILDSM